MKSTFRMVPGWQTGVSIRDMDWEEVISLLSDVTPGTETIKFVKNHEKEYRINVGRNRYSVLLNDPRCPVCGIIGTDWSLDHQVNDGEIVPGAYVLNLYAQIESNNVLMTMDHILPRCNGGSDDISNLRTMCWTCNMARGSTGMSVATLRGVLPLTKHILHNKELMDRVEPVITQLTLKQQKALKTVEALNKALSEMKGTRSELIEKRDKNLKLSHDLKLQIQSKLTEYQRSTSNTKTLFAS